MTPFWTLLFATLFALLSGPGNAVTFFTAQLTNGQEVSPVVPTTTTGAPRPASFGTATFVLDDAQTSLSFVATIFNIDFTGTQTADINDNLTVAHIHGPAAPGAATGVVWGFVGTPFNDTSPLDTVVTPFASGVGGTVTSKWDMGEGNGLTNTLTAHLPNLFAGLLYMNFHTTQFGAGEIRGQIVTPLPGALPLFATGLGALGLLTWRRKRKAVAA